jgi:hypothetical protein
MFANLNVRDDVGDTFSASVTIYDSKGAPHTVTIDFTHNGLVGGNDQWAYSASLPGADVEPPQATPYVWEPVRWSSTVRGPGRPGGGCRLYHATVFQRSGPDDLHLGNLR